MEAGQRSGHTSHLSPRPSMPLAHSRLFRLFSPAPHVRDRCITHLPRAPYGAVQAVRFSLGYYICAWAHPAMILTPSARVPLVTFVPLVVAVAGPLINVDLRCAGELLL